MRFALTRLGSDDSTSKNWKWDNKVHNRKLKPALREQTTPVSGNAMPPSLADHGGSEHRKTDDNTVAAIICLGRTVPIVDTPCGYGLLPLTLSIAEVVRWTGLGKTKVNELCSSSELATAKVDGRTLILTSSVIALIERNRVVRDR